jgi:acyl-CoA synthetase (AMP-forming)/AMP-acid ligase II
VSAEDLVDVVTSDWRRQGHEAGGLWDETTLVERVDALVASRPDDVAVVDRDGARRTTYAELDATASRVTAFLVDTGVEPGDVVSVQLPNWVETVAVALGALRAGAVVNPLIPNYREKELTYILGAAGTRALFTPVEYRAFDYTGMVDAVRSRLDDPPVHVVVGDGAASGRPRLDAILAHDAAGAATRPSAARSAREVSELIFTSGTEADPKGIMHTEQTANFSMRAAYDHLGLGPGDVVWMPSPIGHSTGFNYGVRFALYHGLPLVLQDIWNAEMARDLVLAESCTHTLAATTFLADLVGVCARDGVRLPTLRSFGCGGAPVPPDLVRAAEERSISVLRLYGSTEVLVATWNTGESPADKRAETDGPPLPSVELEVRDEEGEPVEPGTPGELYVRGPDTCVGFFRDRERTAATFSPDGWVRSGDLVTLDTDGYVTVVGRKKEIIIRGGINIAPRELEDLLLELPEVAAAAVVGLPSERLGETTCACVVLERGASLTLDDVVTRLRAHGLATYKLPERLEILTDLPRTASGKVMKHEILRGLGVKT